MVIDFGSVDGDIYDVFWYLLYKGYVGKAPEFITQADYIGNIDVTLL